MTADYNYAEFDLEREDPVFDAFRDRLHAGERPDTPRTPATEGTAAR